MSIIIYHVLFVIVTTIEFEYPGDSTFLSPWIDLTYTSGLLILLKQLLSLFISQFVTFNLFTTWYPMHIDFGFPLMKFSQTILNVKDEVNFVVWQLFPKCCFNGQLTVSNYAEVSILYAV